MGRKVTQVAFGAPELPRDKNVAAYCRVSSGKDAMLHSLEAQVSYYSSLIQNHSGWEYAGVYADEARTGTKDTRENFMRLLADCRAGKIDMVLTKSISRFARNTVTLLETVRELKDIGVDVYFEEQNIHSLSTDGELMLTVLASYAQEESRSASENQKWRIKKNFEEGKPWSSTLLGYRNVNGRYEIVPEEAETVRMIFDWYARVSTDSEEQLTSYEAQVDYYTNYIKSRPEWEFVNVYTDEGISATDTRHRSGFNQMVQDALDGKIDLIVTKSVSRFARNTVDSLTTVRKLKEKGVEVYFQKENIYTLDSKGELLITIMSSLAQEESRSISENVTWGKRKRFADGKVSLAYSSFLGYRKGEDGQMEIVPEEAETVRLIYRLFMEGQTPYAIAKYLTDRNIPTPTGKETWRHRTVENILSNEKYKGDARLQKCYTVDFLSKKRKANEGEVPQYYVEGSHDAIIEPAEWQLVQTEIQRRKNTGRSHNCCSPFSAKLKCGDCGEYFGSKVWHSNSKYKRTIWQCNAKFKGESKCATPHLYEQRIKELFLEALGILMENREEIIGDCRAVMEALADCGPIDAEMEAVSDEMEVNAGLIQKLVDENATRKLDQHDYRKKYDGYASRYAALESRMDSLEKERERKEIQYDLFSGFLAGLGETEELPVDFNEKLFHRLVDYAAVYPDGRVVFTFRNGVEVSTEI